MFRVFVSTFDAFLTANAAAETYGSPLFIEGHLDNDVTSGFVLKWYTSESEEDPFIQVKAQ